MKRSFLTITITCLILFVTLCSFDPDNEAGLAKDVLGKTNQFRKSNGLTALKGSSELNAIAQQHSADMANGSVAFGHDGFAQRNALANESIGPLAIFAENVAYGPSTAAAVVTMWKNSPQHRRNMLHHFKYIGIGIAKDIEGRLFYTQVFAG